MTAAPHRTAPARESSALGSLESRIRGGRRVVDTPPVSSFREFLETIAQVPLGGGRHGQYSFEGREALEEVVDTIDLVLGSHTGQPLADATIALAGGAQFGKTVMELNLGAYCTGIVWRNWGFYLPDDELVQGIVDTKFRPDILDQLDWFAAMTQVGKAVNKSGKAVNRKGAFTVTDGERRANGMVIGLNKVPTSFSFDVASLDEVDDIKEKMEKFVRGRMTSSALRLLLKIGTQRIAGRGMHKAWKDGSQGVTLHRCPSCAHELNLEEEFPRCLRVSLGDAPSQDDPYLTLTGDFRREDTGATIAQHDPRHRYHFACTRCGAPLDRSRRGFRWHHRRLDQVRLRNWSFRLSQFSIPAIDTAQIVADWTKAVVDPDAMTFFNCDRRAMPESTAQKITLEVLDRARQAAPYDMAPRVRPGCTAFAGLDTGRRCWFFAREVEKPDVKRVLHAEQIPVGNVVARATALFQLLGLSVLFIDQAPETDAARTIALRLNGLEALTQWPKVPENKGEGNISFPSGLRWNGPRGIWENLRCAVVAFTKRGLGAGIAQGFDVFEKAGHTMFVPIIHCNRFEAIDAVVKEFLTPNENVSDVIQPAKGPAYIRTAPAMLLPRKGKGAPLILETLDSHLLVGSEREEKAGELGDYVDQCENHLILADAYSRLAETVGGNARETTPAYQSIRRRGAGGRRGRGMGV